MDGAGDLTHTHPGANRYLRELLLTFTFKTARKDYAERERKREWSGKRGRDKWKDHHTLSAVSIQVPKGPLSFSNERMEMLTLKKWQTTFSLLGWEHKGGQKSGKNNGNRRKILNRTKTKYRKNWATDWQYFIFFYFIKSFEKTKTKIKFRR